MCVSTIHEALIQLTDGAYSTTDETGELLGTHIWEEVIIKETGGEYLFCHVSRAYACVFSSLMPSSLAFGFVATTA
jgi:hypothetical protein